MLLRLLRRPDGDLVHAYVFGARDGVEHGGPGVVFGFEGLEGEVRVVIAGATVGGPRELGAYETGLDARCPDALSARRPPSAGPLPRPLWRAWSRRRRWIRAGHASTRESSLVPNSSGCKEDRLSPPFAQLRNRNTERLLLSAQPDDASSASRGVRPSPSGALRVPVTRAMR